MPVMQEELEGGPPVDLALALTGTVVAKVGPRARAVRRVMAVAGQAHPFQVVTVEQGPTRMEELEVLVGRMEVDLVVPVMIILPYMQEEGVVVPGILGAEVDH